MELKGIKYKIFDGLQYIMTARVKGADGKMYHEYNSVKVNTPSVVYIDEETGERATGEAASALHAQFQVAGTGTGIRDERGAYLK